MSINKQLSIMKKTIIIIAFTSLIVTGMTQNVGIGTTTPTAKLDINGDMVLRSGTLALAPYQNDNINLSTNRFAFYKITGGGLFIAINGFSGGVDGRMITLFNSTNVTVQLIHNSPSSQAANTINTGTDQATVLLPKQAIVSLVYSNTDMMWHIVSSHDEIGIWAKSGTNVYTTLRVGVGTSIPTAKLDIVGGVNISDSVNIGGQVRITSGAPGAGKVLTSDLAGLASWQTITASTSSTSSYPIAGMGCQSWMARNLDVAAYRNGDPIPNVTDPAAWNALTTGAYCYYNNDSATNAATYGKLYNWYALNDPRGLAPTGWHIPTDYEWTILINGLGGLGQGGDLKELGISHWTTPNTGATNISGFAGLPGGLRNGIGIFDFMGHYGDWWSSTESNSTLVPSRILDNNVSGLTRTDFIKRLGLSVRCLRD